MKEVEFPLDRLVQKRPGQSGQGSSGAELGRRGFLAASVALVSSTAYGFRDTLPGIASPSLEIPIVADKTNGREVIVGPQIPVITNLKEDLSLDLEAIRFNVNFLVEHGMVTGKGVLLAVGAGGDFDVLNLEERKAAARAIVEAADGRVPVIVGIQDSNPRVSVELAHYAEALGAYGIQMSPPYYHGPSNEDVLQLYRRIHDATTRVGIMIYNTWWHNYNISFEVMDELLNLERVVAIKWSHPGSPLDYSQGVKRYAHRLAIVDNAFMCVLTHLLGGHGFITHMATVWPEHELGIWELAQEGKYQEAIEIHSTDNYSWVDLRIKFGSRTSGESPIVKAALELTGRPAGPSRSPSRDLVPEERNELRRLLQDLGVPNVK